MQQINICTTRLNPRHPPTPCTLNRERKQLWVLELDLLISSGRRHKPIRVPRLCPACMTSHPLITNTEDSLQAPAGPQWPPKPPPPPPPLPQGWSGRWRAGYELKHSWMNLDWYVCVCAHEVRLTSTSQTSLALVSLNLSKSNESYSYNK